MNCFFKYLCVIASLLLCFSIVPNGAAQFFPGKTWRDVNGNSIQAHGGGILLYRNVYYWFGEDRTPDIYSAVSCYSSTNLTDWKREGVALWRRDLPRVNGHRPFVERPKVIYNPATKKFVMWMHLDQDRYTFSRAGIAVSDNPTGPFTFINVIRPIADTNDFSASDPAGQSVYGGTFRDMNLFADDDGKAYVFYSSAGNWTMYVVRLNQEFTGPETPAVENKTWARILVRQMREGPAPFKWHGKYFLITSACTGWAPNAANYSSADNILGPWQTFGNPCVGPGADKTFGSQSMSILPVPGRANDFIFMADRWNPDDLPDSRYVWLPFTMQLDGTFAIPWRDRWSF
ncbi:MAG TPA: glycoside hydrolase family 43 protein [Candidatus Acidoferrales bacterium]|nr:glycoside hydrolase family 43 protein [Candidatus Acidoferrales bacterium]